MGYGKYYLTCQLHRFKHYLCATKLFSRKTYFYNQITLNGKIHTICCNAYRTTVLQFLRYLKTNASHLLRAANILGLAQEVMIFKQKYLFTNCCAHKLKSRGAKNTCRHKKRFWQTHGKKCKHFPKELAIRKWCLILCVNLAIGLSALVFQRLQ